MPPPARPSPGYRELVAAAALAAATSAGCASYVSSATTRMAHNLSAAVLNQTDPETVRQGAPAYLLLVDSLIGDDPENGAILQAGARLYVSPMPPPSSPIRARAA
jgi:hypothetical protein